MFCVVTNSLSSYIGQMTKRSFLGHAASFDPREESNGKQKLLISLRINDTKRFFISILSLFRRTHNESEYAGCLPTRRVN